MDAEKKERVERIESMASKFTKLETDEKGFATLLMMAYTTGVVTERDKWENKQPA